MSRMPVRAKAAIAVSAFVFLLPSTGWSQQPAAAPATPTGPTAAAPAAGEASETDRARLHYERGIQLFNEENFDAALFEFERAFELAPSYKILYNMAKIQRQQNNYAAALQNFTRYLSGGGANIPEDRRKEVTREIELLNPRVATIEIKVNVDGADVFVDDSPICTGTQTGCVGKSPLGAPVTVNPGRRKITAQKPGFAAGSAVVRVVGSDKTTVTVELVPINQKQRAVDPAPRNRAIVALSVTGVLAAGAAITGVLALSAQSKLKDDRNTVLGVNGASTLNSDSDNVKTMSLVSDIFTVTAVVGGLVSGYLTYKWLKAGSATTEETKPAEASGQVSFDVSPMGAMVFGKF